jgi:hypothetical protein
MSLDPLDTRLFPQRLLPLVRIDEDGAGRGPLRLLSET